MLSWTERILTKRLLGDWNRGVYNSQVLEERQDAGPKAGCRQRVVQDLRHMPLLGSRGGVLWGSWAKATLANSNQKEQSFGKLLRRSYLGGTQGEDPGSRGECLSPGPLRVLSGIHISLQPCELLSVALLEAGTSVSPGPFQVTWPCRMKVKARMLWNSVNSQQWGKTIICQEWKSRKPN